MKYLNLACLILCVACGKPTDVTSNPMQKTVTTTDPVTGAPTCALSIVGKFQNVGDGIVMTVSTRNGECGFELSCGFKGYVYPLGGNMYRMIANASEGDTWNGCGLSGASTVYEGKSGQFYDFGGFSFSMGQWLGYVTPGEVSVTNGNQWAKLQ